MKRICLIAIFIVCVIFTNAQPIKVMLVTGGHAFDTVQFFEMFDALPDITYLHFQQPKANNQIVKDLAEDFDVIVFYDMWKSISEIEKNAYFRLTQEGKPLLFLHHSIASYQDWPEFEKILGGKYVEAARGVPKEEQSNYEHDVWVYSKVENYTAVTVGFKEPRFFDEVYGNVRVSDEVLPLLRTRHPKSMEYIAWQHKYNNSQVVYLQPGHDYRTFVNDEYRKLLVQAIKFLAGTNKSN
ncbi:MAG TPA: ThuA domain-containing protein [Draconibacterium sp.]|nr:ThuA domain-containing protein [Draconibacterium sp.]